MTLVGLTGSVGRFGHPLRVPVLPFKASVMSTRGRDIVRYRHIVEAWAYCDKHRRPHSLESSADAWANCDESNWWPLWTEMDVPAHVEPGQPPTS